MQYRNDEFLNDSFKEALAQLLADYKPVKTKIDKELMDLAKGYFELGFDAGCNASAIYSKELKELYKVSDISQDA